MRSLAVAAGIAVSVALTACGGGGGSSSADSASKQMSTPAQIAVSIDAEGDSTMYGLESINGTFVQSPQPVPALVQASLRAQFGINITVENKGSPGANLRFELQGTDNYSSPLATRLAADSSQVVLENFGINDSFLSEDEFRSNLVQFIVAVRAAGKTPVLEEPNPVCQGHETLDQLVAVLGDVAAQNNVVLIKQYDYIKSLPNWQSLLTDCVHPSDALYAIKAQREAAGLVPIVAAIH